MEIHAFVYKDGTMTDLDTLGGSLSYAFNINDDGKIVGRALTGSGEQHAFLYDNGMMTDLDIFTGYYSTLKTP